LGYFEEIEQNEVFGFDVVGTPEAKEENIKFISAIPYIVCS
jgi:hypothetical protein